MTHSTAAAPAAFEPLGGIVSGDGVRTNEDVERTRRYLTVEQAEHMSKVADQLAEDRAREHTEPAGLLTVAQQTLVFDAGLGAYRTARIETDMRDVDSISSDAENARTPLFSAEMVVADQVELWFGYGTTIGEVSPGKAREIVAEMRAFAARLEALCDVADGIAADDYEARG